MWEWTLRVGAVLRGAELTCLGATDHGTELRDPFHMHVDVAADVVGLGATNHGAELGATDLGAQLDTIICGAEPAGLYLFFLPELVSFVHPFSVFIRTSTRPNEKFNLGKSD